MKRGQVTVFIVVGVLALAAVFGLYSLLSSSKLQGVSVSEDSAVSDTSPVTFFVEQCAKQSTHKAISYVLQRGGYYTLPFASPFINSENNQGLFSVPYYFSSPQVTVPSLVEIQTQVQNAAKDYFVECLGGFEAFNEKGIVVSVEGKPVGFPLEVSDVGYGVVFEKGRTSTAIILPLQVRDGESVSSVRHFQSVSSFDFVSKYESITSFLGRQKADPTSFLVGDLSGLAYNENATFSFQEKNDSQVLVGFTYETDEQGGEPITYNFGLKYEWEEESEKIPHLGKIPDNLILESKGPWEIEKEGTFLYQIDAKGSGLRFKSVPDSLSIDEKSGVLSLNTLNFENDEYLYYIVVDDEYGNERVMPLVINVNVKKDGAGIMQPIPQLTAKVGTLYEYQIKLENDQDGPFLFSCDDPLVKIDNTTGLISFIATQDDIGLHSVRIDVQNNKGRTWQRVNLVVK